MKKKLAAIGLLFLAVGFLSAQTLDRSYDADSWLRALLPKCEVKNTDPLYAGVLRIGTPQIIPACYSEDWRITHEDVIQVVSFAPSFGTYTSSR